MNRSCASKTTNDSSDVTALPTVTIGTQLEARRPFLKEGQACPANASVPTAGLVNRRQQ